MLRLHPTGYAQHERTSHPARPERSAAKSKGEQGVFTTHRKKDPYIVTEHRQFLSHGGRGKRPATRRDVPCLKKSVCSGRYIICGQCAGSNPTRCRMHSFVKSLPPVCARPAAATCNIGGLSS